MTTIGGVSPQPSPVVQSILQMSQQLDDLQSQLGTGQKSDTYAGLGLQRGFSVSLHGQLSAISSYDNTIGTVSTTLSVAQSSLTAFDSAAQSVKQLTANSQFSVDNTGQSTDQKTAAGQLDQLLGILNTQVGNNYIFSGQSPDQPSVASMNLILNGDATHDGLKTVIAQRNAADLGADGLGRLVISVPTTNTNSVSVTEDVAGSPFGFKLAGVSTSIAGATVTGPPGTPGATTVDLTGTTPNAGDTVTYSFNMPDGTSETLALTATTSNPPGANQFTIGATPAATASNLQSVLTTAVGTLAQTSLSAASAVAAANNFFSANPPLRVAGPPPYTGATSLVDGSANTVQWYTGENGSTPARSTATARVDPTISVSYGMRANEQALTTAVSNVAVLAAMTFSSTDPNASARYSAVMQRVGANLDSPPGTQKVSDIEAELAGAQTTLTDATDRHQQTSNTLTDMLQQIENVSPTEVGTEILALQTRLQASLQTTAMLYQTSLVNYLPPGA